MNKQIIIHAVDIHDIKQFENCSMLLQRAYYGETLYDLTLRREVEFKEVDAGVIEFYYRNKIATLDRNNFYYIEVRYY